MLFLAFWVLPYLSSSVPRCFLHPDTSLVQLVLGVHTHTYVIPPCTSPNGGLCLIHPWLDCSCCNTLPGDQCFWKWQCWLYPSMWHLWGVVVVLSMPAASETQHRVFLQVQKQCCHLTHANSCPLVLLLELDWKCDILLLFSLVWLFLLSMQVNTSGDGIRGNVAYLHTWA